MVDAYMEINSVRIIVTINLSTTLICLFFFNTQVSYKCSFMYQNLILQCPLGVYVGCLSNVVM